MALAGGTGSGKSSLFNRLASADFSTVGVTRPITRDAHACVWGVAGAGPLLEWLGVPRRYRYARSSALDRGEEALAGLVLLDLPDHDSVVTGASGQVDRLVGLADLMVWVLDPQKYADAAVHRRFLVPLAGHAEVVAVVLNQCDLLTEAADRGLHFRPAQAPRFGGPARGLDPGHLGGDRSRPARAAQAADRDGHAAHRGHRPHLGRRGRRGREVRALRGRRPRQGRRNRTGPTRRAR